MLPKWTQRYGIGGWAQNGECDGQDERLADVESKDSDVCYVCATAKQVRETFKVNDIDSKVRESARSDAVV